MNQAVQKKLSRYLVCFLLAAITLAAFAGLANSSFIALDDGNYVTANYAIQHGLSWNTVKWAFGFHSSNWHPLTWLSHALDCQWYGLNPAGHHLTNLALHVANTILLFLLLENLTVRLWPSAFVALLFGIHPMHVESVAWVSERKDVLSTFFFLLTLLAYARYIELTNAKRHFAWAVYGVALLFFALGLMAKPMLVTLPFVLLLLDYWPLQRFDALTALPRRSNVKAGQHFDISALQPLLIEKIPFFLLAAVSCWITFIAQKVSGAVAPTFAYSLDRRLGHTTVSYAWYLLKCLWPAHLSIYYEMEKTADPAWNVLLAVLFLFVITIFALALVRKYPFFFFGWFWFLGMLIPVIGLVQVGGQSWADRYTYLPYIGLFIILAWGLSELVGQASCLSLRLRQAILCMVAILVAVACFWRTVQEVHYWKSGILLFQRAVEVNPDNETAWAILGAEYGMRGNSDKAIESVKRSLTLNDRFSLSWEYLGRLLARKGDFAAAKDAYQNALKYSWYNGDTIDIDNEFGRVLVDDGKYDEAIAVFQNSLQLSPDQPEIQTRLGECLVLNKMPEQAAVAFQDAIDLQPDNAAAQLGFAMLLTGDGRDPEAVPHFQKALEIDTNSVMVLNNFAWLVASSPDSNVRNGQEAVALAERACQQSHYQQALVIGTLAAAYAEAGRFDDAVAAAQKAHDVALAQGQKDIAAHNLQLMELYKSRQPFHAPALSSSP